MSWLGMLAWPLLVAQVPAPPDAALVDGVQWSAPPDCPDRYAVLAGISQRLGRPLAPGQAAVDARVVKVGPRFNLRVQLHAGERREQRELTADSCAPLLAATALLVAHAVEAATPAIDAAPPSAAVSVTTDDPPAPEIATPELTTPEITLPHAPDPLELAAPPPSPSASRGPGVALRLQGGPELGAVPGLTGGVELGVGLLWRRLRIELQGLYLAPRGHTTTQTRTRAALFAGSLHACVRLGRDALELPICGGLELGGIRGEAHGPTADAATLGPWFGVVLGVGVGWHLRPRLSLTAALQAVGGVVRPSFVLRDPGDAIILFRPAPVSGRLLLGLELRLRDPW